MNISCVRKIAIQVFQTFIPLFFLVNLFAFTKIKRLLTGKLCDFASKKQLLQLKSIPTLKILCCSFRWPKEPAKKIKDLKLQLPHIRINEDYLHIACSTKEVNGSIDPDWLWEIKAKQQDLFPEAY